MESKITKQGTFERVVEIDVPENELTPHFDSLYRKYRKNVKLEGFRKGKVPLSLIKKLYGDAIKSEAIDEVVQSVFKEVKEQENLRPVAPAKLEDIQYDPAEGLHFKAVVEVVPEIDIKKYTGLSVEREIYQVDDEDVAVALEDVREQMAVMQPVESEAEEGHFILADFQQVDSTGLPIIGKKFEDRFIQLSDQDFNRDLSEQLVGVKPGETRQVEIAAVDANGRKQQPELYQVNVKEIKSKQLPELDDELAKDAGKFDKLDDLKEDLRERLIKQAQANARRKLHRNLIDELLKKNSFDLPESMISNYLDVLVENAKKESQDDVDEEAVRREYRPSAIWNLKWELAKDKIKQLENIDITDEDKNNFIARIADERGVDKKELQKSLKNKKAQTRFEEDVLEEKILDFLATNAKIKEKKVNRKDVERARKLAI